MTQQEKIIPLLAEELALSLSDLSKRINASPAEVKQAMDALVAEGLAKVKNGGTDPVYSITSEGVVNFERQNRTGLARLFR